MIAKKYTPKRFEFFCVQKRSAPTSTYPGGEDVFQLVGVRMILDYGTHSCQDFRLWSNFKNSPCYTLMTDAQDKRPRAHFPRWIWHVVPMKEFKQYAENEFVDHRLTAFSCWAPFPPGEAGSERFYEVFFDWWTPGGLVTLLMSPKPTS